MDYKTIKRSSTSELVLKEILENIRSGELKPGDKLPTEHELMKLFGVGRSSLREAISALVLVGYIEVIQGRGTFVNKDLESLDLSIFELRDFQTTASIIDLIELREILECNTARLAARRAGSDDISRLRKIIVGMKKNAKDTERFSEHDFDFHVALAEASGNQMILQMMNLIVKKVHDAYVRLKHESLFDADQAIVTVEQLVTSIVAGDGDAAAKHMGKHLGLVTTQLKQVVSKKVKSII